MKLGKLSPKHDPRDLKLSDYLKVSFLPPLPEKADWTQGQTAFGMMANDTVGDCTCATVGHAVQVWTANASSEVTVPDADVLGLYSAVTGYDPNDPSTDNGAVLQDVLKYVQKQGVAGHTLQAYVGVDPKNHDHMKATIALFGGVAIGVEFMQAWEGMPRWTNTNGPIAGGHAIWACAYDPAGLTVISWGGLYWVDWDAIDARCDEAWAVLSPDWQMPDGMTPAAFDVAQLQADLALVQG